MSWTDTLIGAGAVLAGGGLTYIGTARDRHQRAADAREDRNHASRRDACLLLERQRARQLEVATELYNFHRFGGTMKNPDHSDLHSSEIDALVSLFLPDRVGEQVKELNQRHDSFITSVNSLANAPVGLERAAAVDAMNREFASLLATSVELRNVLRDEAQSK